MKLKNAKALASRLVSDPRYVDFEISISIPGHPVDGAEIFSQPSDGSHMVAVTKGNMRAFLWLSVGGKPHIRNWCRIGETADIQEQSSLENAVEFIATHLPATDHADDFEDLRRAFLK